ncbi:MAG TPA: hypothetical protein VGO47_12655 [Chlamydiales bacterium]|nr:hypothetical protein [Chlamydiales bacterium]
MFDSENEHDASLWRFEATIPQEPFALNQTGTRCVQIDISDHSPLLIPFREENFEFIRQYFGPDTLSTTPLPSELSTQNVCTVQHTENTGNITPALYVIHRSALHNVLILWYISSHFTSESWPQGGSTFNSRAPIDLNVAYRGTSDLDNPHYGAFDPAFHNVNFLGHFATPQNEVASGATPHEMSM